MIYELPSTFFYLSLHLSTHTYLGTLVPFHSFGSSHIYSFPCTVGKKSTELYVPSTYNLVNLSIAPLPLDIIYIDLICTIADQADISIEGLLVLPPCSMLFSPPLLPLASVVYFILAIIGPYVIRITSGSSKLDKN
jgi:hypothetical protein